MIGKDSVQASEKLYKAAEETVKAFTQHYGLNDILSKVNKRDGWTFTDLEKTVLVISRILGKWFGEVWDRTWALHITVCRENCELIKENHRRSLITSS